MVTGPTNDIPVLSAHNIYKKYITPTEEVRVADNLSIQCKRGEIVMIFGPSGSGKTTLLNMLSGLDTPDSGDIYFEEKKITDLKDKEWTRLRLHRIALVFQSFELIQVMSNFDNIAYPLILQKVGRRERDERINAIVHELGIKAILSRNPNKISIGQKQRVAIARSLVLKTDVVLGDEITGNLDHQTTINVCKYIKNYVKQEKKAFIIVTHNREIQEYADRVYHLSDGSLQEIKG
ncbi:MAG: ABC transporter ATP-binding protein [Chitinivibrionales bacterium]|nr:ABC transporter ATP-binding protein [Chitinivibrionales bacterium]